MGHPLRIYNSGTLYEATTRTIQSRFLLKPTQKVRLLILGVLGRALTLFPQVRLHAFAFLSNHSHLIASALDGGSVASFMGYVNGNIAREIGRLHRWTGRFWQRRARLVPILDDDAAIAALRYVMAHGVKEGLVFTPADWPGASSLPGLLGKKLVGTWIDRTKQCHARAKGQPADDELFAVEYPVVLTPLPCWVELSELDRQKRVLELVKEIEKDGAEDGQPPMGVAAVLRLHPHHRPAKTARSPAPLCRTSRVDLFFKYRQYVREVRSAYLAASEAVARGAVDSPFPAGTFPRARPFIAATRLDFSP